MRVSIDELVVTEIKKSFGLEELTFIDSGGFKAVYKGCIISKPEAIKIVPMPEEPDFEEPDINKRIIREIEILNKCKSPYLVKLGSIEPTVLKINNKRYLVYSEEFLEGETVHSKIVCGYKPCLNELKDLILNILDVIDKLWNSPSQFIHRDIKPLNIISTNYKRRPYVLLDLGIAFAVKETGITSNSKNVPGTLYYLAPEMLMSGFRSNLDFRADLYALGLTVYEYASGKNPFARSVDDIYTTLSRIKRVRPIKLHEIRNDLPKKFCNLIDQLLKKIPALRPNIKILSKNLEEIK